MSYIIFDVTVDGEQTILILHEDKEKLKMRCAVKGCSSSNENKKNKSSFFSLPIEPHLHKKWIRFIDDPSKKLNPRKAHVCELHFKPEDFENTLKYEMGFATKKLLKKGVVPSLIYRDLEAEKNEQQENYKEIVSALLREEESRLVALEENEIQYSEATGDIDMDDDMELNEEKPTIIIQPMKREKRTISNSTFCDSLHESVAIQTDGLTDSKMCAFLSFSMDSSIYQINCFYCEEFFLLEHWTSYVDHMQSKHFEDLSDAGLPLSANTNSTCYQTEVKEENVSTLVKKHDPLDLEPDVCEITSEENVKKKYGKRKAGTTAGGDKAKKMKDSDDCSEVLSLDTTDPIIVFGLLDILYTSYPLLWFIPPTKCFYHEEVREINKILHEKFQLVLPSIVSLQRFIQEIVKWFIQIKADNAASALCKPHIDYYKKCEEFLSDKSDCTKTCEICEDNFPDLVQYLLHKKDIHNEAVNSEYLLDVKKMRNYIDARYHYRIRQTEKLECKLCNAEWNLVPRKGRKEKYFNHLKGHANLPEFVCDFCGKAYRRWNVFVVHQRRHTGIIKRPCLICERSFNSYWDLTVHRVKRHRPVEGTIEEIEERHTRGKHGNAKYRRIIDPKTQKKRIVCNYCNKDFSTLSSLGVHSRRVHKAEWAAFHRKGALKKKKKLEEEIIEEEEEEYIKDEIEFLEEDYQEEEEDEDNEEQQEEENDFEDQEEYLTYLCA